MKHFIKENWLNVCIVVLAIVLVYSERETVILNKWNNLCSDISKTEIQIRKTLDIKMGNREKEWCKNTFYKFFK